MFSGFTTRSGLKVFEKSPPRHIVQDESPNDDELPRGVVEQSDDRSVHITVHRTIRIDPHDEPLTRVTGYLALQAVDAGKDHVLERVRDGVCVRDASRQRLRAAREAQNRVDELPAPEVAGGPAARAGIRIASRNTAGISLYQRRPRLGCGVDRAASRAIQRRQERW